jgi:hypothetical protein
VEYKDNWDAVASTVATKTRDQCMMQFLQLVVEDELLEEVCHRAAAMTRRHHPGLTRHTLPQQHSLLGFGAAASSCDAAGSKGAGAVQATRDKCARAAVGAATRPEACAALQGPRVRQRG